ncbi:hypothetical protein G6F55_014042 [Rhizopus delemar]|nr:hypothetical protein G6F55_014042 [Rhizopus delemar]
MGRSTGAAISLTVAMPCSGYRNSHFQSSATTSTTSGLVPAGIELVRADPGQRTQRDDDQQRRGPDQQLQHRGVVPFRVVVSLPVAGPIAPREQESQEDHRHDDQQHQAGGDDDQITLMKRDIA